MDSKTQIKIDDLLTAVEKGMLSSEQTSRLWNSLSTRVSTSKESRALQCLYYLGFLLIIAAMTGAALYKRFTGLELCLMALCSSGVFFWSGLRLWRREGFQTLSQLLIIAAIYAVPVAIYGLEKYTGIWPLSFNYKNYNLVIQQDKVFMELGALLASMVALKRVRFPFLVALIGISLWLLATDSTFCVLQRCCADDKVALCVGLLLLGSGYFFAKKGSSDFAFWSYLVGTVALGVSLFLFTWHNTLNFWGYGLINIIIIMSAIVLKRKGLMSLGVLGFCYALFMLDEAWFQDTILWPCVLSGIGSVVLLGTMLYQKKQSSMKQVLSLASRTK